VRLFEVRRFSVTHLSRFVVKIRVIADATHFGVSLIACKKRSLLLHL
jgi:hypothetical protein